MLSSSPNADFLDQWRFALAPYNLGYKVKLVSQLMYRDFLERLEPYGLTPFHYLVLCCLWEEDGLSTSGIADKLKQLGATLTGVVDRMEDRHLVYRERDPSDRRIIRIWLTDEGRKLMDVLPAVGAETIQRATAGVSEADQAAVMQLLEQIIHNLT
ncbi:MULTISPECIES: MarR family transcriptional regulator [Cyanophyceae]|uniref:MarR family winged helix-turn-helix transcriptional regulator n=1 Tax=Cyanophyceae TaxID=3028117 RepID=UPI00168353D1|nr:MULTISPECIES: MarR family transcriptional regulator [Cyanophyceae]MBD1914642.1 MarR family transcriptional regulator [Phormidium sp. FACHB-77]MBD2030561.1 MarR family transcriptional regulator [Phormidium sp. FACHB-322]MBD2052414.1 MarR family transcriptional regulator [Leptolyngbya sp. FACHB-60]